MIKTKKIPKNATRNANTITESMYFSKIRSALRNAFRYWKPMQNVLEQNSRKSQSPNKRLKKEYLCNHCKTWFPRMNIEIDHIISCGSLKTYEDIVPFIKRLTAEDSKSYQLLCKPCHLLKTNKDNLKIKNKINTLK